MKIWKALSVILLLEIAFFSGIIIGGARRVEGTKVKYLPADQGVKEPSYIYATPSIAEDGEVVTVKGIGIFPDEETGAIVDFTVTAVPGDGEVLIEVSQNTYGEVFQVSLRNIKRAVEISSGRSLNLTNIRVDTTAPGAIKGSSGSLALGIGLYSLADDKPIREDVAVTGVLNSEGSVSNVGLLSQKIEVAKEESSINTVIIPSWKCSDYEDTEGIEVECVNSLEEAMNVISK